MENFFKKYADFSVILAGILWGIIGIFVKSLGDSGLSAFDMMLVRSFFALIIIFIFLFIWDREKLKINLKDIWIFMCLGIVSFFMYGVLYFITIEKTSNFIFSKLVKGVSWDSPIVATTVSFSVTYV